MNFNATKRGAIAAGHPETAEAARLILEQGGCAFDAVLAAHLAACVVEPVFTSLGGGGFLLAHTSDGRERVYDFFVQTPLHRSPAQELDLRPIEADFGTARQEFHVGMASIGTPGFVKGIFRVHRDLCRLPMTALIEPAVHLARRGVRVNALQAYGLNVVKRIYTGSPGALAVFGRARGDGLVGRGEVLRLPLLADTLDILAHYGERWFYRGEIAAALARDCRLYGGHLSREDLARYRVAVRRPLAFSYRGARLLTNPLPSCGGSLVAFSLKLLEDMDLHALGFGNAAHLRLLAEAMALTNLARADVALDRRADRAVAAKWLGDRYLRRFRDTLRHHRIAACGTTHVSVIDAAGNLASMTSSNGEGSGYMAPNTGIMFNNMLGEEDINPFGLEHWPTGRRLASMMAPTLVFMPDGSAAALGSGGANRIRTAILQVLLNLLEFGMPLKTAVDSPRVHFERGLVSIEQGFEEQEIAALQSTFPRVQLWNQKNLFFGGVHSVSCHPRQSRFDGAGDPRRGGSAVIAGSG